MGFCSNCGAQHSDNARFCEGCGFAIASTGQPNNTLNTQTEDTPNLRSQDTPINVSAADVQKSDAVEQPQETPAQPTPLYTANSSVTGGQPSYSAPSTPIYGAPQAGQTPPASQYNANPSVTGGQPPYSAPNTPIYGAPQARQTPPASQYNANPSVTGGQPPYSAPNTPIYGAPQARQTPPASPYNVNPNVTGGQQQTGAQSPYAAPSVPHYGTPQAGYPIAGATVGTVQPKKKSYTGIILIIVAVVLAGMLVMGGLAIYFIYSIFASGSTESLTDPNVGIWHSDSATLDGNAVTVEELFEGGVTLELRDNGRAVLRVGNDSGNGTWEYDYTAASSFIFDIDGVQGNGEVSNGVLTIYNLMDYGVNINFEREGGFYGEINEPLPDNQIQSENGTGGNSTVGGGAAGIGDAITGGDDEGRGDQFQMTEVPNATVIEAYTLWYGSMQIDNYSGSRTRAPLQDIWAEIAIEDTTDLMFLQIYDTIDFNELAIFSAYIDADGDSFAADIGESDAFIFDEVLDATAEPYFSTQLQDGVIELDYHYNYDGEEFDVTIFLRLDGARWNEASDPLPPTYQEYKQGMGF